MLRVQEFRGHSRALGFETELLKMFGFLEFVLGVDSEAELAVLSLTSFCYFPKKMLR